MVEATAEKLGLRRSADRQLWRHLSRVRVITPGRDFAVGIYFEDSRAMRPQRLVPVHHRVDSLVEDDVPGRCDRQDLDSEVAKELGLPKELGSDRIAAHQWIVPCDNVPLSVWRHAIDRAFYLRRVQLLAFKIGDEGTNCGFLFDAHESPILGIDCWRTDCPFWSGPALIPAAADRGPDAS